MSGEFASLTNGELTVIPAPEHLEGFDNGWVNPDNPADRLLAGALLAADIDPLPKGFHNTPVADITKKGYEGKAKAFTDWAATQGYDVLGATHAERCAIVEDYLAQIAPERSPEGIRRDKTAIRNWAKENRIDSPVTGRAKAIKGTKQATGKAVPLSDSELSRLLTDLDNNAVLDSVIDTSKMSPVVIEAWHLRQMCQVTIAVTCSLRTESEFKTLTTESIVWSDEGIFTLQIDKTKGRRARKIALRPRNDLLCPVTAVGRWMDFCKKHSLHRPDDRLFPHVKLNSYINVTLTQGGRDAEAERWKMMVQHLDAALEEFNTDNRTLHGCRHAAPTRAAEAQWSILDVRDLLDHKLINTTFGYTASAAPADFTADIFGGDTDGTQE